MLEREYRPGDIIIREGDPSNSACMLLSGEVEVFTEFKGETLILGVLKAGEFLGEMGVVDEQPRSASARAKSQARLRIFDKKEFFELISRDSESAHRLISRLCGHVRRLTRRLAEAASAMNSGNLVAEDAPLSLPLNPAAPAEPKSESTHYRYTLLSASPLLRSVIPSEGIELKKLPFSVGRIPKLREPIPGTIIDLQIPEKAPFRLSRQHFALKREGEGCGVLDLDSTLGTQVNGKFLGRHFVNDFEFLKPGENMIVAGGMGSPFVFKVLMEPV